MRKLIFVFFVMLSSAAYSQIITDKEESKSVYEKSQYDSDVTISVPNPNEPFIEGDDNKIYIAVEIQAEPKEGVVKFREDFLKNIKRPKGEADGSVLRVMLNFIVEKDGSLTNIRAIRDPGYGMGEQCVKVLKKSGKWKPAQNKGVIVRSQFTLPITINLVP